MKYVHIHWSNWGSGTDGPRARYKIIEFMAGLLSGERGLKEARRGRGVSAFLFCGMRKRTLACITRIEKKIDRDRTFCFVIRSKNSI